MKSEHWIALQNIVHETTNNFLNGSTLILVSKALYPLVSTHRIPVADIVLAIKKCNIKLTSKQTDLINKSGKLLSSKQAAEILAMFNSICYHNVPNIALTKTTVQANSLQSYAEWKEKTNKAYHKPVKSIVQSLKEERNIFSHILLGGSLSTHDFIYGWSDVDMIVVLQYGTVTHKEKLAKAQKALTKTRFYMHAIDPFQHHGCICISTESLACYSESYFPTVAIQKSSLLLGKGKNIAFSIRDDSQESLSQLNHCFDYLEQAKKKPPQTLFDWKGFYHVLAMLPIYYYQVQHTHLDKKEAFARIRSEFSSKELKCMDIITNIRNEWSIPRQPPILIKKLMFSPFHPAIYAHMTKTSLSKKENENLLNDSLFLTKKMKRILKDKGYI